MDTEECFYGNEAFVNTDADHCINYCILLSDCLPAEIKCVNNACVQVMTGNDVAPQIVWDNESSEDGNTGNCGVQVQIANPASVYCEAQGGTLEIVTEDAGQYGMCHLPGNITCEEWAYYDGECPEP